MISIKKIFYEKKSTKIILNVVSALAGETDDIKTDDDDVIDSHACMVLRRSLNAFYNNKQVTLEMKFKKKNYLCRVVCISFTYTRLFSG